MPIADCCTDIGCAVSPHAVTGWCLAATGEPVLAVTTLTCPPGIEGAEFTVTLIDPATGDPVAPQAIVACGDKDWEANTLCDFDPESDELIATFIQVFEWDESTQSIVITNVRSDDPTVTYVPVGVVRACAVTETTTDVEVTPLCYDDPLDPGSVAHGWQAWIFVDAVHSGTIHYDIDGTVLIGIDVIECPPLATEATLATVLAAVDQIEGYLDQVEPLLTTLNAKDFATQTTLAAVLAAVDGLEVLLTSLDGKDFATETTLAAILAATDQLEGYTDQIEALLTSLGATDFATETTLAAVLAAVDQLEGYTDGLEAALATLNGKDFATQTTLVAVLTAVDQLEGYTDGIEALLTTLSTCCNGQSTTLSAILAAVDGLEGFTDGIETLLSTISGNVDQLEGFTDGIETALGTLNAKDFATQTTLAAILAAVDQLEGYTDGLEALLTTLNAKDFATQTTLAAVLAAVDGLEGFTDQLEGYLDGVEGSLTTLNAKDFATQTTLAAVLASVDQLEGYVDGIEGQLTTLNAKDFATQTTLAAVLAAVDQLEGYLDTVEASLTSINGNLAPAASFSHGQTAVGAAAAQINAGSVPARRVLVKAHRGNLGIVYIGSSAGVTVANGFELAAGDGVTLAVDNVNDIWAIRNALAATVSWAVIP